MEEQYANLKRREKERNEGFASKLIKDAMKDLGKKVLGLAVDNVIQKIKDGSDPDNDLKKEVDHLRLEDQKGELQKKIDDRNNSKKEEKFDIGKWRDADTRTMDYETAEKVSKWYNMAKTIETNRSTLNSQWKARDESNRKARDESNRKAYEKANPTSTAAGLSAGTSSGNDSSGNDGYSSHVTNTRYNPKTDYYVPQSDYTIDGEVQKKKKKNGR